MLYNRIDDVFFLVFKCKKKYLGVEDGIVDKYFF